MCLVHRYSLWAWVKGRRHGLESPEKSLEWEALGRHGELLLKSQSKDIPRYPTAMFLEESMPLPEEKQLP